MNKTSMVSSTVELSEQDLRHINGGLGPLTQSIPMAEDMYGNKMSHEEWMDYMAYHIHQHGDATSTDPSKGWVHDFTN